MAASKKLYQPTGNVLNPEQEELLDLYLQHLDSFFEGLKKTNVLQVEIETMHLKKILTK
jgi:hypothetical protein